MQQTSSKPAEARSSAQAARLRFPKSARLQKHSDFERVYRHGRRYSLPNMAVFYLRSTETRDTGNVVRSSVRVGFTVPRALGGAVQRNRIKRRMREAVRLALPHLTTLAADVVINPRVTVAQIPFPELLAEVNQAFEAIEHGKGSIRAPRREVKPSGKR